MKCPYCGNECADQAKYCDLCKQPLPVGGNTARAGKKKTNRAMVILGWVLCAAVLLIGIYKVATWVEDYKITRLYTRGEYTPTISTYHEDDGRLGHAVVFYGEDGDMVFLPELNRSVSICGGVARMEIADSEWFGTDVSEYEYADITFAPILVRENGARIQLPEVNYTVDAPEAPIEVTSPSKDRPNVVTSAYPLELKVVPNSEVFINGEDLTPQVDRGGNLSVKVSVRPIGDNTYTVIVRTPHHKETRKDIVIYRQAYDIEIELDNAVSEKSSSDTMVISGTCEPGAMIEVDSDYLEKSLEVDMTTGKFSFIVEFKSLGNNTVRFRATKEGREDAVISFSVYYIPSLPQYSAKAWKMDYDQLRLLFEQWTGRIFKCVGPIVDSFEENGVNYLIMDVGKDGQQQLIVLENQSGTKTPSIGPSYTAWADVSGRYMYNSMYYPMLIARYLDLTASN